MKAILCLVSIAGLLVGFASAAQDDSNSTNTKRVFTYSGSLLDGMRSDWTIVSIVNDRAVIGFKNGSARNAPLDELDPKDKSFLQNLQNGTYSTPLSSTKEKLAQWSSQFTSTVSKLGKSVKEQLDSLISNSDKKKDNSNATIVI